MSHSTHSVRRAAACVSWRSRRLQEQVLADSERLLGNEHPDTITARTSLASTLLNLGDHRRARRLQAQLLADSERLLGSEHPDTSRP